MRASLSLFGQSQARSEGIAAEVNNAPLICWGKGFHVVWDKQKNIYESKFQDMATKF